MNITEKMTKEELDIYNKYSNSFPFPLVAFAKDLDIQVCSAVMPNEMSGAISKENNKYIIYLNEAHNSNRMRFTLAHELAHYFNDKDFLDQNGQIEDLNKQTNKKLFRVESDCIPKDKDMVQWDIKANKFAAELLMPEEKFIEVWKKLSSLEEVAEYFKVSIEAAKIRASNLLGEML